MNQPDLIKVCLFLRVSSERQTNDRQVLELTNYCKSHNYEIAKTIASKISGSKAVKDRPDLIELLSCAKKGLFNKVLVTEISRIGRNAKDIRNTIDQLHELKVSVVFKNLGVESLDENLRESFVTNVIIGIYSELAAEEKRILIDRIKSGLIAAKAKGKKLGRPKEKVEKAKFLNKYKKLAIDIKRGLSLNECKKLHSVSKNTVIKAKKYLLEAA